MNQSLASAVLAVALSAALPAFAFAGPPSPEATDQVVASFGRILKQVPSCIVAASPTPSGREADPLLAGVNAVLWQSGSYHLPAQHASFSGMRKNRR